MMTRRWICLLGAALLALSESAWAQKGSSWRVYKLADGMPESACISVTLAHGKVVAKHLTLPSITELDGYDLHVLPAPEDAHSRVYQSPAGQLWTVMTEGLRELKDGKWVLHPVPQIATAFQAGLSRMIDPVPLYPVKQGTVLFLLPEKLMRFNADDPDRPRNEILRSASDTQLGKFLGMCPARDGGLWVSGTRGLAKAGEPIRSLKTESPWQEYPLEGTLKVHGLSQPLEHEDGVITMLAEADDSGQRVIVQFDGQRWTVRPDLIEKVRHGWRGPNQSVWAATIESLFQAETSEDALVENDEISARQYFDVAVEAGGAFWLATSEGLFRYAPLLWRSPALTKPIHSPVHGMTGDREGHVWFVTGGTLHLVQAERHSEFALPVRGPARLAQVRSMFPLKDGSLLLHDGERAIQFQSGSNVFRPVRAGQAGRVKPLGLLLDGSLCLQSLSEPTPDQPHGLQSFDGQQFQPLTVPQDPPPVELGENLLAAFAAQNGDLWLSSDRGTAWYHDRKWQPFVTSDRSTPESVLAFVEFPDGKLWAATSEMIWEFDGRNWLALRRGFDRINAFVKARDGSLWVASSTGLHRFFQGAWVEYTIDEGLPSDAVREICEDHRGAIWAGTTRGPSVFYPGADAEPPRTLLRPLTEEEKNLREGKTLTLTFTGQDKWKHTPRSRLLYSYRLDDSEWSAFSEANHVSFSDLPAGKHYFQVRAMDRNCNIDPKPAQLEFAVVLPWFKETRLVLVMVAGLATALFFAGLAFNRHQRLLRSYAEVEKKVAERTSELEIANRELVHSQKMNALGTLAAGIAHDFNNILSIIKGSTQIIEENLHDPQKIRTRADRIKTVVEQGAGIVKAMLGFTRDSEQQPGLWEINGIVEDTLKLLGDRFLREVEVRFEPAPELPRIQCPRDFVQQILLNFIFNAAEASSRRKQILLATKALDRLPPELVLTPAKAPGYVAVSVQDFGVGIVPENLPRIFEPFFTTKALSARRGTGLGLSMVYELARKMEAGLAVCSVVERGSTFTLLIPAHDDPSQKPPPSHLHEPFHHSNR